VKHCNGKEQFLIMKPTMHLVLLKNSGWTFLH